MILKNVKMYSRFAVENYLTFPVSRQSFHLVLCRAATKACDLIHGICLGHRETFGNPHAVIDTSQTPYHGILHSWNQNATGGNPCETVQGDLLRKVENKLEAQFHCSVLQEDHQP